jgi:transposase
MVVDGAINGAVFLAYVEQVLAPELRAGDVVVVDNLSSHKVAGVKEAIEGKRARLVYLVTGHLDPRGVRPRRVRGVHPPLRLRRYTFTENALATDKDSRVS